MAPALLEDPAIRQRAFAFTVAQYHALGERGLISERVELLEGVIVEKTAKHRCTARLLKNWPEN